MAGTKKPSATWRLLAELKPFKKTLTIIAVTSLLVAVSDVGTTNLIKYIFDSLQSGKTDVMRTVFGTIVALALLKAICRYLSQFNMNYLAEVITIGLQQKLQHKFMRLNLSFHNSYYAGSGGLLSRILNDLVLLKEGLRLFADFFREPLSFVGLVGTLFYLNAKLTAMILIILPIILYFLRQISKSLKKYNHLAQENLEKITSTVKESLDGVRIIQSFNLEEEMESRFGQEASGYLKSRRRIHSLTESSGPVTEFIITLVVLGIIFYMTIAISKGRATYGDFMSYVSALLMLNGPVKKLQESFVRIQGAQVASARALSLIDEASEVPQVEHPLPFPRDWKEIEYRKVSFRYGRDYVLKDISFQIHRGETLALVGSSGSGKSTIVNLLERFFDPAEGEILVDGVPLTQFSLRDLRHNIALVSQDVFLFSDSISHNIQSGDFSKIGDPLVMQSAQHANAHDFIMRTQKKYETPVGDRGNLLSGGEKQRISIARAIFKNAPILILDEATSALDSTSELEVQKGLDRLMEGRTCLVIAHRLSTISKADRIIVLKSGKIVEVGSHQELLALNNEYAKLYQL